ncbi:hypothetical protein OROHE_018704 [Orobanche hederae]
MMNLLALGLVLTSLLTAGLFTPSPENQKSSSKEEVIVKEGHRVVVVEFEKDDAHTKVVISPQDSEKGFAATGAGNAKEKLSEKKTEDVKQITPKEEEEEKEEITTHQSFRPRELVCDAYGKCKHKIASAFGKTKDTVVEKANDVVDKAADKVSEVKEGAKEAVSEAIDKVKNTASHTAHQAFDKMHESKESVKESAGEVKDTVADKAGEIKEGAKEKAHDLIDTKKKAKEEFERNASRKMEETMVKKEGKKKELLEIMHHAREVGADFFEYVFSTERLTSVSGILHLMGFSAAYGMCVWVTFASSYVMAEALPRHQFAMAQSKIYPVYFKAMAYSVGMAILGHMMNRKNSAGMFHLFASLVMVLVNLLCLEPRATKVMLERMKKEKEEGIGKEGHASEQIDSTAERAGRGGVPSKNADGEAAKSGMVRLSEKLQRLNSYSSFLNVLTLVSLTWHLVLLGQHLVSC